MTYAIFKIATDGSGEKWDVDFVPSLEAMRFLPHGRQVDAKGRPFVYSFCLARYWQNAPSDSDNRRDIASLGPIMVPMPSAAAATIGKLIAGR